ncbi:MAG TPA: DUF484 family protein [Alphaproteobacteria bacterium]|nr:DUF484 family protein [Alphaproteobacteria bacterium]
MPTAANAKKASKTATSARLTAPQVLGWLQAHPAFFAEHADTLQQLMVPKKSGNILSLHAARAEKSTQAAEKLAIRQQRYVATARANAHTANAIFGAVIALLACKSISELRHLLQTSLKDNLGLEATRLLLVGPKPSATGLTLDEIDALCPESVKLRSLTDPLERKMYGPKGNMLKSDALLRLVSPAGATLGLLTLASGDATRFHDGQSTELAAFFAAAVGACLAKLNG